MKNILKKPTEFRSVEEIEEIYKYDFSDVNISRTFILELFNEKITKYFPTDIDQCIIVMYYHYTFNSSIFLGNFNLLKEDFKDDIRLLRLLARYYKRIGELEIMLSIYKKAIEKGDRKSMLILSDYCRFKDIDLYYKCKKMYIESDDYSNSKYQDLYQLEKEIKSSEKMIDILFQGIENDECECFDLLFKEFYNSQDDLKRMFLKIKNYNNQTCKMNLDILIDRINFYDPKFMSNLIENKRNLEILNNKNDESDVLFFFCSILFLIVIIKIF